MDPSVRAPRVRAVLRATGPRVARDAFGPLAAFFVTWKLVGLVAGIAAAVLTAGLLYGYERRRARPGMVVRFSLGPVLIRAGGGLVSGGASAYLGRERGVDLRLSRGLLGALLASRPLPGL